MSILPFPYFLFQPLQSKMANSSQQFVQVQGSQNYGAQVGRNRLIRRRYPNDFESIFELQIIEKSLFFAWRKMISIFRIGSLAGAVSCGVAISKMIIFLVYCAASHVLSFKSRKFLPEKSERPPKRSSAIENTGQASDDLIYYNIYHPSKRIQCDDCRRCLTKTTKVLVQDQDHNYRDYCLACFSNTHQFDQDYRLSNKLNYPLFELDWTAEEQLLLFQGLESHGFGNWTDIADFIGNGRSREQVEDHYQRIYLKDELFMPSNEVLTKRNAQGMLEYPKVEIDSCKGSRIAARASSVLPSAINRSNAGSQPNKPNTNPAEVVGFMPRRGDFQIQYDNDAELLLAEMEFNDDDTEEQKAMKFRLIDIYNHKLNERIKRKEFVISRKLLDIREQMRLDKTRTREQKQIYNLMKVVARFSSPEEHDKLVQGIIKEKQLRQRIAELKELQNKGYRTLGQVQDELQGKKRKDDRSKKRQNQSYGLDKSKTRRVARKDPTVQRSEKKVLYVSKEQEELCRKLNMTFKQYTNIKETILRQAVKMGMISRDETTQMFRINKNTSEAVFDFLVEQEGIVEKKVEMMEPQP